MWLGSWRNSKEKPFGFKWPHDSVHALGIHFSYDIEVTNKLNFEEKIHALEQILHSWKRRNLTLIGRINIVSTWSSEAYILHLPLDNSKPSDRLHKQDNF